MWKQIIPKTVYRKISKLVGNSRTFTDTRSSLDTIVRNLSTKEELNDFFDLGKISPGSPFSKYVLIFGSSRNHVKDPHLLLAYPKEKIPLDREILDNMVEFCFPKGVSRNSQSAKIQNQFTFCMTSSNRMDFCFCTHFINSPRDDCVFGADCFELFCICTVSEIPNIEAHFNFHTVIIDSLECGSVTLKIGDDYLFDYGFLSDPNFDKSKYEEFKKGLELKLEESDKDSNLLINAPDKVCDRLINSLRIICLINPTERISVHLRAGFSFNIYPASDSFYAIALASFGFLFTLDVTTIVRYFRALLLEQRIVITSGNLSTLTMVVLSSLALVNPLSLQSYIVPISPNLDFLHCPSGYVFGVFSPSQEDMDYIKGSLGEITLINIEEDSVTYPDSTPHLPGAKHLRSRLLKRKETMEAFPRRYILSMDTIYSISDSYRFSKETIGHIIDDFKMAVSRVVSVDQINKYRIRDTTNPDNPAVGFLKDIFLEEVRGSYDFYDAFLSTNLFIRYCDSALFQ